MKYRFYNVLIIRDAHFHIPRVVSEWELPILEAVHTEQNVEKGEEFEREMGVIDVASERARLERLYKRDEETKDVYVEAVYGKGSNCLKGLQRAIDNACVDEKPKKGAKVEAA